MAERDGTTSMESSLVLPEEMQRAVLHRLRRMEGQVCGVQRMVERERDCREVLRQIAAIRAAARRLGAVVLEHYVLVCLGRRAPCLPREEARALVQEAVRQIAP